MRILIFATLFSFSACAGQSDDFKRGQADGFFNGEVDAFVHNCEKYGARRGDADGDGRFDTDDYSKGWVWGYHEGFTSFCEAIKRSSR